MKFTKNTFKRAARTFLQAAVAYGAANIAIIDFNADVDIIKNTLIGLFISAVAAGLAAAMNLEEKGRYNG